jgi:hypothetical protein
VLGYDSKTREDDCWISESSAAASVGLSGGREEPRVESPSVVSLEAPESCVAMMLATCEPATVE